MLYANTDKVIKRIFLFSKDVTTTNVGSGHNVQTKPFGTSYLSTTNTSSTRNYQQQQTQQSPSIRISPAETYSQQQQQYQQQQYSSEYGRGKAKFCWFSNLHKYCSKKSGEEPSYLKSETLKLIQQNEHTQGVHKPMGVPCLTGVAIDEFDPMMFQSRTFRRLSSRLNQYGIPYVDFAACT